MLQSNRANEIREYTLKSNYDQYPLRFTIEDPMPTNRCETTNSVDLRDDWESSDEANKYLSPPTRIEHTNKQNHNKNRTKHNTKQNEQNKTKRKSKPNKRNELKPNKTNKTQQTRRNITQKREQRKTNHKSNNNITN